MTDIEIVVEEQSAGERAAAVPLSHLSIELGHLYMDDFVAGPERIRRMFEAVAPWARTAREVWTARVQPKTPRISTCFLVDDYFTTFSSPAVVVPMLVDAAKAVGLQLDYLAREAACAQAAGVPVAEMVVNRLVIDPPQGTNGSRPPSHETGWVCNGTRSPDDDAVTEAMQAGNSWQPPSENGANRHSIFVDVQLWDRPGGRQEWSCAMLAAVWQLLRLGMLRYQGGPVIEPEVVTESFPDSWSELPALVQLTERAAPFSAYGTYSVLGSRFLPTELAVRTVLSQVAIEPGVVAQVHTRATGERLVLPAELIDRIEYTFVRDPS